MWFIFKCFIDFLNFLKLDHTQHLDELNKLQRGIVMDLGHIEAHQVVQNFNNLPEKDTFSGFNLIPMLG